MITREFNLYLHAGHSIPLVINVNQYDQGEQWLFTLFNADGTQYTPSSGAIVGIKSDNLGIINSGTVDSQGRVVINETQQMTASVGKAVFELLIDDQTHGTANFVVLVEPKPGDNADLSESDYSLFQQAIDGTSATAIAEGVADWMDENLTPTTPVVDASLTVQGAAADSAKVGQELSDLKSEIAQGGVRAELKDALMALVNAIGYIDEDTGATVRSDMYHALYDVDVVSLSATVNSHAVIYDDDSLNDVKNCLTVTAYYSDGTHGEITSYQLSGTLEVGTCTLTVTFSDVTTTVDVTVIAGLPSGYTEYDYITSAKVTTAPVAQWITLATYEDMNALSVESKFSVDSGYYRGATLWGKRIADLAHSYALYVGDTSTSTDTLRFAFHQSGNISTSLAFNIGTPNIFRFNNTAQSPSEAVLNGDSMSLAWDQNNVLNFGVTLFTNPTESATTMTLQEKMKVGYLKFFDLSGDLVGDYVPVLRVSDNRIGMFDKFTQTFYTSETASYTTQGNSACKYSLGNWS